MTLVCACFADSRNLFLAQNHLVSGIIRQPFPAEKNAMTEAATARGLNLSSWVRMILLDEARRTTSHETGTKNRRT